MKRKAKKQITAAELMAQLNASEEFQSQHRARQKAREEFEAKLSAEERPLISDLCSVGFCVDSVWDLVNWEESYPGALPVLQRHLKHRYHPRIREGIARALTVPEARGMLGGDLVRELERSRGAEEKEFRWTLANALTVAADPSCRADIQRLLAEERFRDLSHLLREALDTASSP